MQSSRFRRIDFFEIRAARGFSQPKWIFTKSQARRILPGGICNLFSLNRS